MANVAVEAESTVLPDAGDAVLLDWEDDAGKMFPLRPEVHRDAIPN